MTSVTTSLPRPSPPARGSCGHRPSYFGPRHGRAQRRPCGSHLQDEGTVAWHRSRRAGHAPEQEGTLGTAFVAEPASTPFRGAVVGIGASAGGLDALERFFGALPVDSGAAFVVIQHLSPDHKSMMDNLLSRYTSMPVRVIEHEMRLLPDAVFLIPPGKHLRLVGDRLMLGPKAEHGLSLPIDIFFNSLAEHWADNAIAVVLSGTGSDGSRGVAAVNAAGGFVFVQDPTTAKFDGMPRSAIGTGLVDVVAPAEELGRRLLGHLRAPRTPALAAAQRRGGDGAPAAAGRDPRAAGGQAAASTSASTSRPPCCAASSGACRCCTPGSLADYQERLAASTEEQALLRRELLIPVTRFFRDVEAFEQLAEQVLPALVSSESSEPIRVWVACCATGEEAYSMAILFAEAFHRAGRHRQVKIFATDVEQQYLDHAAAGVYPDTIAAEVSARRLEQYFASRQGSYVVRARDPADGHLRAAQPGRRPALHPHGPGQLPQRADLLPADRAGTCTAAPAVRAADRRPPAARPERVARGDAPRLRLAARPPQGLPAGAPRPGGDGPRRLGASPAHRRPAHRAPQRGTGRGGRRREPPGSPSGTASCCRPTCRRACWSAPRASCCTSTAMPATCCSSPRAR